MYQNDDVKNHIEQSSTVNLESLVVAEWNLNIADNINKVGNYRYRPEVISPTEANYGIVASTFDDNDALSAYTGATDSYTVLVSGLDTATDEPTLFTTKNKKEQTLYSLSDCLNKFRPRSGINKLRYFTKQYLNSPNKDMFSQPRYYISSKDDKFKYWDSYREESSQGKVVQRGLGTNPASAGYYMDDAAPFVAYKNPVPANRIVVKMQTHASDFQNPAYKTSSNLLLEDPFYESPNAILLQNQITPYDWKIEYLDSSNNWVTAKEFVATLPVPNPNNVIDKRTNGKRIVPSDGYVELFYGITNTLPTNFKPLGEHLSVGSLPLVADIGDAYLVPDINNVNAGTYYVWNGTDWTSNSFVPTYGWYLGEEGLTTNTPMVTELASPKVYGTPADIYTANYREFEYVKGIRVVAKTISQQDGRLELIEMSPRLVANFSDRTVSYSIDKIASDIGNSGFPVGDLSVSQGDIDIFDYDQVFNPNNVAALSAGKITGSILSNTNWSISSKNLQLKFYEGIKDVFVDNVYKNYYVPVKTMYIDGFPSIDSDTRHVKLKLRDLFFYFESINAPQILLRDVTLTYAVSVVLDSIGFSNYIFKYAVDEDDFQIPFFYVQPDINVAEMLKQLAISSQTAMFFDENNNFILMSKNYLMGESRDTDITLYGTKDFVKDGIMQNKTSSTELSNIMSFDSEDSVVYNGGKIIYSNKYLQKSFSTVKEVSLIPKNQVFRYKPVLLWEVAGTPTTRSQNEEISNQNSYSLAAMTLNETLTNELPYVDSNGNIQNDIMDFGQTIYWATRYNGYLYANGEIIKYDAIEHSRTAVIVSGILADVNTTYPNILKITDGNISKLKVGQKLTQTGGSGTLAPNTTIEVINKVSNTIKLSDDATLGQIQFDAVSENINIWISSVEEYQKYFSELPFNGKLYPTGRVRIYTEPYYNADGTINKLKPYKDVVDGTVVSFLGATVSNFPLNNAAQNRGAVAKHGRIQFETGELNSIIKTNMPVKHNILDGLNPWLNESNKKTFDMDSDWIFKNNHEYIATNYTVTVGASAVVYSTAGSIFAPYSAGPSGPYYATINNLGSTGTNFTVGEIITATNGTGTLAGTVTVLEIINGTTIKVKSTAGMSAGTITNISGVANKIGSRVLNLSNTTLGDITSGFVFISISTGSSIPTTAKIESVKTFKVGATTYNQIILSKKIITANIASGVTVKFADKATETLIRSAIPFNTTYPAELDSKSIDLFDVTYYNESTLKKNQSVKKALGSIRSSALNLRGNDNLDTKSLSYIYKPYAEGPTPFYFGTRMKILGEIKKTDKEKNEVSQLPIGLSVIDSISTKNGPTYEISGTGGGIAINLDVDLKSNIGYYFEIDALTMSSIIDNTTDEVVSIPNVYFYKISKGATSGKAIPQVLWYGTAEILCDDGLFAGLESLSTAKTTSYDLAIEQIQNAATNSKTFNLYINNKLIAIVTDPDAIPTGKSTSANYDYNNAALFVRGSGDVLFENFFAISTTENRNIDESIKQSTSIFNSQKFDDNNFRPYLVNPSVLSTYLQEIGTNNKPAYSIDYEEFGTIMRECAYFNVRYDKAYPALYSKISPTLNKKQGYVISGYTATAYGAEFLIFNATDFALTLDDTTGNYLRIQGVSFTQQSEHDLTVDEYFTKHSDSSNYTDLNRQYVDIQNSRNLYNRSDFTIQGEYIQSLDVATNLMKWIVDRIMKPKKSIGVKIFANPMIQLGDIVTINYNQDGVDIVSPSTKFVVYHTTFNRSNSGPEMTLYLSEVV